MDLGGRAPLRTHTHLGQHLCHIAKVLASSRARSGEEVLYQAGTHRVAHLVELFVDLGVVFIVFDELNNKCAIGQGEELGVLAVSNQGPMSR